MFPDGSLILGRLLATECTTVIVTSAGEESETMPVDLSGTYFDLGTTTGNRPVYHRGNDSASSDSIMYWTGDIVVASEMTLRGSAGPDFGWQDKSKGVRPWGANDGSQHAAAFHGVGGVDEREEGGTLAACETGGWVLRETSGGYPAYMVLDCAYHPADISSGVWYKIVSRDSTAETMDASFAMVCLEPEGGDDDLSPQPGPITNSPAVQILFGYSFSTIAPGASIIVGAEDRGSSSSSPGVRDPSNWLSSSSTNFGSGQNADGGVNGEADSSVPFLVAGVVLFATVVLAAAGLALVWRRRKLRKARSSRAVDPSPNDNSNNARGGDGEETISRQVAVTGSSQSPAEMKSSDEESARK